MAIGLIQGQFLKVENTHRLTCRKSNRNGLDGWGGVLTECPKFEGWGQPRGTRDPLGTPLAEMWQPLLPVEQQRWQPRPPPPSTPADPNNFGDTVGICSGFLKGGSPSQASV